MKKSTILIIEDHPMMRASLRLALDCVEDFLVVAEAGSVREGLEKLEEIRPDLVLLDLYLPDGTGMDVIGVRNECFPEVKILVITNSEREDDLISAVDAGAESYVLKETSTKQLIHAVRTVLDGYKYLSPTGIQVLINRFQDINRQLHYAQPAADEPNSRNCLSLREKEILALLANGASNPDIAEKLSITESTVRTHFQRILKKLGLQNRSQAMVFAVKNF